MKIRNAVGIAICAMLVGACSEYRVDHEAEKTALMELSAKWSDLAASGDLEAGIDFWADDAVVMPPDLPPRPGD